MSDEAHGKSMVELQNVSARYPNGVLALEGITFEAFERDMIGVIGPNGSGKSTLLKLILGLMKPNTGTVKLFGESLSAKNLKLVGYVPQKVQGEDANFPSTVLETVLLGRAPKAGLLHRLGRADQEKAQDTLKLLDIYDLRDRKIGELSGGQTQRVLLAKALVGDPKLLVLDEPTSGVDVDSKNEFYTVVSRLNRENGMTIILASHEISIVAKLVNRVLCINRSQLACGDITDLEAKSLLSDWLHSGVVHQYVFP
jgi:zinc transport system ATP-binding protein